MTWKRYAVLAGMVTCMTLSACTQPPAKGTVMMPGMMITATTSYGTIKITAGQGNNRTFEWDGHRQPINEWTRPNRWYGQLGIYYPAPSSSRSAIRVTCGEGQVHVKSVKEALKWMRLSAGFNWVYTSNGLAVGFSGTLSKKQINVHVAQFYIDGHKPNPPISPRPDRPENTIPIYLGGHKPKNMPGARDEAISVKNPAKQQRQAASQ